MISYPVYKLIHLAGILALFMALGGVLLWSINGRTRDDNRWRKTLAIVHGVALFVILLGGFGALARLGIMWPWPGWIVVKFTIWLILGGLVAVIYRKPAWGVALWWLTLLLGITAAYVALLKPF